MSTPSNDLSQWFDQALQAQNAGHWALARERYQQILAIQPDHVDALHMLGVVAYQTHQFDEALVLLQQAIRLKNNFAALWLNLGNVYTALENYDQAQHSFEQALALSPALTMAHYNLGRVFQIRLQHAQAIDCFDNALALEHHHADAWNAKAISLKRLGQWTQACAAYEAALACRPNDAHILHNLGVLCVELHQFDRASKCYEQAILIDKHMAGAYWSLSLLCLLQGQYEKAWPLFEWRWKHPLLGLKPRNFNQPSWDGQQSLQNKTLLIYAEQGFGDTIQFLRFVPLAQQHGARVVLWVHAPLRDVATCLPDVQVISQGDAWPAFDMHIALLSLPYVLKIHQPPMPMTASYLTVDVAKKRVWEQRLTPSNRPRIGLVWSGNPEHLNDHQRSIALSTLVEHLPEGFDYVALQKECRSQDLQTLQHSNIQWWGDALQDFSDTAALCVCMDLVISVDTSVAHLSGALGVSTWLLLPYTPDWRWGLSTQKSDWYEHVQLWRQNEQRSWSDVLVKVAQQLKEFISKKN